MVSSFNRIMRNSSSLPGSRARNQTVSISRIVTAAPSRLISAIGGTIIRPGVIPERIEGGRVHIRGDLTIGKIDVDGDFRIVSDNLLP